MITFKVWVRHPEGLEDLMCPVILCDGCREPITGLGLVLWFEYEDGQVWHVHKGACDRKVSRAIRQATGKGHEKSRDLAEWLTQLRNNTLGDPPPPWASPEEGRTLRATRASEITPRALVLPPECRAAGCHPTARQDGRLDHHRPDCRLPSSYRVAR